MQVVNRTRGVVIAHRLFVADTYFSRLRGLIGHPPLAEDTALWIEPCQQVHTHFMRYPLHVLFLNRQLQVLRVVQALAPWRVSPWVRQARSVLELSATGELPVAEGESMQFAFDQHNGML